jgi:transposase
MDRVTLYELVPKLSKEGWRQSKIAEFLSISQARVSQILRRPLAELPQWGGHLKSKLSSQQRLHLVACLQKGALHYGFEGDIWTSKRVQALIQQEFGVSYHADYMPDLLRSLGFTRQKPQVKDVRQDPQKVAEYVDNTLPALKKS